MLASGALRTPTCIRYPGRERLYQSSLGRTTPNGRAVARGETPSVQAAAECGRYRSGDQPQLEA